jgi:hypothetical protein
MLVILILIFNALAALVGLVGFLLIGEWFVVGLGLLMMFLMPHIYPWVASPHLGLLVLSHKVLEKGWTVVGDALGIISALYNNVVIAGWLFVVFRLFLENQVAVVPFCWAYSIATVPFLTLASAELRSGPNAGTLITVLLVQITALALGVARYVGAGHSSLLNIVALFIAVATIIQGVLFLSSQSKNKVAGPSKKCVQCGAVRSIDYFGLDDSSHDGHGSDCVACLDPEKWALVQRLKAQYGANREPL